MKGEIFLFRSVSSKKDERLHAEEVLRMWNVKIGSLLTNMLDTKEEEDAAKEATAVDEGGPTLILSLEFLLVEIRMQWIEA